MKAARIGYWLVVVLATLALSSCGRMKTVAGIVGDWVGSPRIVAPGMPANQKLNLKINKDETCTVEMNSETYKGTWTLEEDDLTIKLTSPKPGQTIPDMKLKIAPDLHTLRYDGELPGGVKFAYVFLKDKKAAN